MILLLLFYKFCSIPALSISSSLIKRLLELFMFTFADCFRVQRPELEANNGLRPLLVALVARLHKLRPAGHVVLVVLDVVVVVDKNERAGACWQADRRGLHLTPLLKLAISQVATEEQLDASLELLVRIVQLVALHHA